MNVKTTTFLHSAKLFQFEFQKIPANSRKYLCPVLLLFLFTILIAHLFVCPSVYIYRFSTYLLKFIYLFIYFLKHARIIGFFHF